MGKASTQAKDAILLPFHRGSLQQVTPLVFIGSSDPWFSADLSEETKMKLKPFARMLWTKSQLSQVEKSIPHIRTIIYEKWSLHPCFFLFPFLHASHLLCVSGFICVFCNTACVHSCVSRRVSSVILTLLPETLSLNLWLVSNSRSPVQGWKGDFSLPPP